MIYLASPWSSLDATIRKQRYEDALAATTAITKAGRMAFSPIVYSHHLAESGGLEGTWTYWQEFDHWFIERCSFLWVLALDGWKESVGVTAEIDYAATLNKPMQVVTLEECLQMGRI